MLAPLLRPSSLAPTFYPLQSAYNFFSLCLFDSLSRALSPFRIYFGSLLKLWRCCFRHFNYNTHTAHRKRSERHLLSSRPRPQERPPKRPSIGIATTGTQSIQTSTSNSTLHVSPARRLAGKKAWNFGVPEAALWHTRNGLASAPLPHSIWVYLGHPLLALTLEFVVTKKKKKKEMASP